MRIWKALPMIGLFATTACYRYTPPGPPVPSTEVPIRASFGRTWDVVIDLFADQNLSIATIERASGIVVAIPGVLEEPPGSAMRYADCGKCAGLAYVANRVGYNIRVKGDSARSTLRVNAVFRSVAGGKAYECSTKNVWEATIAERIQRKAEQP